jgi:hypothetical protein
VMTHYRWDKLEEAKENGWFRCARQSLIVCEHVKGHVCVVRMGEPKETGWLRCTDVSCAITWLRG